MLAKIERLIRRGVRALSKSAETVTSNNKDNLPSGNKELSPSGDKEHTPKVSQVPSSSHPIMKWLQDVTYPVDESRVNELRPKVDNIDFYIDFSETSERSTPAWFNETWDNDPEIRRFLCEDNIPHDQVPSGFHVTQRSPHGLDTDRITSFSLSCYPGPATTGGCSYSPRLSFLVAEHYS